MKESDLDRVREAYLFAEQAHSGQVRKSGEPYILHPLAVADIVVGMQMDPTSVVAALLHDVVEDTSVSLEEVRTKFGNTCAMLVDGLTKLERFSSGPRKNSRTRITGKCSWPWLMISA